MNFSEQDRRLLRALQLEARISNHELAEKCGMSPSACWRRVKTFEEAGIISRYSAIMDPGKVGLNFDAIVHVSLSHHEAEPMSSFMARMSDRPEVIECLATTGEADYHLRVMCRDKDAYNIFLEQFLFRLPGIANVRTNLVLREIKTHGLLPA